MTHILCVQISNFYDSLYDGLNVHLTSLLIHETIFKFGYVQYTLYMYIYVIYILFLALLIIRPWQSFGVNLNYGLSMLNLKYFIYLLNLIRYESHLFGTLLLQRILVA
jgi:hypothetical protein